MSQYHESNTFVFAMTGHQMGSFWLNRFNSAPEKVTLTCPICK